MARYRLVPVPAQEAVLREHCAHARYVWNLAIEQYTHWHPGRKGAPDYLEQARQLTGARAEHPWLAAGSQMVQQQALRDFAQAIAAFFSPVNPARRPSWRKAGRDEGFRIVALKPGHAWPPTAPPGPLFAAYNGPLYQVKRTSDGATTNISTLSAGGYANAAAQDSFCSGTYCTITEIFDQSGRGNNLTIGPAGGAGGADIGANAAALPAMAGGHKVYGVYISPGMGYRNDRTSGVATGSQPQGAYMVASGTHVNSGCCFDYGNAETSNNDTGNGHMDAVYFGTLCWFGPCTGSGPWVQADLENGLFSGGNGNNPNNRGNASTFVTALVKNNGTTTYAIKGGNADSGALTTWYSGSLPTTSGYKPMHQEGAIILGVGGDNSNSSAGSFFEGVMTAGYPTDAADNSVQTNITSVGYANFTLPGNPFTAGARISLRATTACCTGDYLTGNTSGNDVGIASVTSSSSATLKADATWIVEPGLANSSCVSFESANGSGDFIRHSNFQLFLEPNDGSALFAQDATFCPRAGNSGSGFSFMSYNFSNRYIRHFNFLGYIASDGGSNAWDATSLWPNDTTWLSVAPWA